MLRGLFAGVAIFLLTISLLGFGFAWDLSSSLTYKNVESNGVNAALSILNSQFNITQQVKSGLPQIEQYCKLSGGQSFNINYQGYSVPISCQEINNTPQLINDTLKNIIHQIYYKNYSCSYWSCFSSSSGGAPLFLISEKSHEYWNNKMYYFLVASLIFAGLYVLFAKKRATSTITLGIVAAASSLPFLAIQKIVSMLPGGISRVSSLFLSQSSHVFVRMVVAGAILFAAGIITKIILMVSKRIPKETKVKKVVNVKQAKPKNDSNRRK